MTESALEDTLLPLKGLLCHLLKASRQDVGVMECGGSDDSDTHACHILGFYAFRSIIKWYLARENILRAKLKAYEDSAGRFSWLLLACKCQGKEISEDCCWHSAAIQLLKRLNAATNLQIKHMIVNQSAHNRIERSFVGALATTSAKASIKFDVKCCKSPFHKTQINWSESCTYFQQMYDICDQLFGNPQERDTPVGKLASFVGFLVKEALIRVEGVNAEGCKPLSLLNYLLFELRYISESLHNAWAPSLKKLSDRQSAENAWETADNAAQSVISARATVATCRAMARTKKRDSRLKGAEEKAKEVLKEAITEADKALKVALELTKKLMLARVPTGMKNGKEKFSLIPQQALKAHASLFADLICSAKIGIPWNKDCGLECAVRKIMDCLVERRTVVNFLRHFSKSKFESKAPQKCILNPSFLRGVTRRYLAPTSAAFKIPFEPDLIAVLLKWLRMDCTRNIKCTRPLEGQTVVYACCSMGFLASHVFTFIDENAVRRDHSIPLKISEIHEDIENHVRGELKRKIEESEVGSAVRIYKFTGKLCKATLTPHIVITHLRVLSAVASCLSNRIDTESDTSDGTTETERDTDLFSDTSTELDTSEGELSETINASVKPLSSFVMRLLKLALDDVRGDNVSAAATTSFESRTMINQNLEFEIDEYLKSKKKSTEEERKIKMNIGNSFETLCKTLNLP